MDRIEKLYDAIVATKNQIIGANLRLVVSIAKRHVGPAGDFFELVSDGNMSLIRAVDKFDFSRGNKFSTYASWAIMKNFARTIPNAFRHRDRFCTTCQEMFSSVADVRPDHHQQESAQIQRASHVERLLNRLDQRERQIVTSRFGLIRGEEPLRLKQVGAAMGVSKERVRQIQCRAMSKLRRLPRRSTSRTPCEQQFDVDRSCGNHRRFPADADGRPQVTRRSNLACDSFSAGLSATTISKYIHSLVDIAIGRRVRPHSCHLPIKDQLNADLLDFLPRRCGFMLFSRMGGVGHRA